MSGPLELAAIDRGSGPPVALVHGGIVHSGPAWAANIGPLVEHGLRAVAVDRRGHGRSPAGEEGYVPVHLQAEDLRLTLEMREALPVHLAGVSYGALICLEFALSWPEKVWSMTLLEPPLLVWLAEDDAYPEWYARMRELAQKGRDGAALEEWFPDWMWLIDARMGSELSPASKTWGLVERHAPRVLAEQGAWEYRPDEARVRTLQVPSLVLNGGESQPPMQALGEMLAERLPRARHVRIPGAGHDAHARRPGIFNSLLLNLVAEHGPEDE